ncbi:MULTISPECIES: GNAT family N-acetyltransferase [Dyella]|uniref:GNAT family N-acetyltransferase n=2 Tax=Dyella TaxID=231454 RepID=A0A4R0YDP8_9GAMM|nr:MULTISPECIES: GNAT family N-acetyltransferase [Dyella]TBR36147.1 GNAT family N-acetyltransferase [Dyella terrae]TCI06196.1 GNAT family N-acetyltransferase [Dyella soli]
MNMQVACVASAQDLREIHDELDDLARMPGAASGIVQHPDWALFELESRGPAASLHLLVVRDEDGHLTGYAPLIAEKQHARLTVAGRHLPLYHGRVLRLLGEGVVAMPEHRDAVEKAVVDALRRDRHAHVLRIDESKLPNTFAQAMGEGRGRFRTVHANLLDQINWVIDAQPTVHAYLATLGSRRRSDLARRLKNMYSKLGDTARMRVFETPEEIGEYCALLNDVYARTWHAKERPLDWQLLPRMRLFHALARAHRVIGHVLMVGDRPIAYVHGYRLGNRYQFDDIGYDEAYTAMGVGSSLVFQTIQDIVARFPDEPLDFGYGDNVYKRVFSNRDVPCGSLYLVRGVVPMLRFQVVGPVRWLYRKVRKMVKKDVGKAVPA